MPSPRGYSLEEVERALRDARSPRQDRAARQDRTGRIAVGPDRPGNDHHPVLIDLRSPAAHRRGHPRGAISIPASRLTRSLFLLPRRDRALVLLADHPEHAADLAADLERRGFRDVGWMRVPPRLVPASLQEEGIQPNRAWAPAPWLLRWEPDLPLEGAACDLACGSGRNAVFLALAGRNVLAVDILPDALAQGRTLFRAARVDPPGNVRFHRVDLTSTRAARAILRPESFEVVLCFRYLQRDLFPLMRAALRPGGWLVFETFLTRQREIGRKPSNPAYLLRPGELRESLAGLEIVDYREGPDEEGNWMAAAAARRRR